MRETGTGRASVIGSSESCVSCTNVSLGVLSRSANDPSDLTIKDKMKNAEHSVSVLNVRTLVGVFNQEKALSDCENIADGSFAALAS